PGHLPNPLVGHSLVGRERANAPAFVADKLLCPGIARQRSLAAGSLHGTNHRTLGAINDRRTTFVAALEAAQSGGREAFGSDKFSHVCCPAAGILRSALACAARRLEYRARPHRGPVQP